MASGCACGGSSWSREESLGITLTVLGGMHYGYNLAIPAVAAKGIAASLGLHIDEGYLTSITLLGALLGSPLAGAVAETSGRRMSTILGESLSVLGAVACSLASSPTTLAVTRFVVGLGVGFCTLCKPLYISETVLSDRRGTVLALFAPSVAVGILIAEATPLLLPAGAAESPISVATGASNASLVGAPAPAAAVSAAWRLQVASGAVLPATLLAIAVAAMPESPAWLAMRASGSDGGSGAGPREGPSDELLAEEPGALALLGSGSARRVAFLATLLAFAQQGTGAAGVILFPKELVGSAVELAGAPQPSWALLVVPASNLAGAVAGTALIGAVGCRRAMLGGLSGMTAATLLPLLLPRLLPPPSAPMLAALLASLGGWAIFFQLGPGCSYFVAVTEAAPPRLRALSVSLGNSARYFLELLAIRYFVQVWGAASHASLLLGVAAVSALCALLLQLHLSESRHPSGGIDLSATWRSSGAEQLPRGASGYTSAPAAVAAAATPPQSVRVHGGGGVEGRGMEGRGMRSSGSAPSLATPNGSLDALFPPLARTLGRLSASRPPSFLLDLFAEAGGSERGSRGYSPAGGTPPPAGELSVTVAAAASEDADEPYAVEGSFAGRAHPRCRRRFSSFETLLQHLAASGSILVCSTAVRLTPAAQACIEGWSSRLGYEHAAAGAAGHAPLLQQLVDDLLQFQELRDSDLLHAFVFDD
ncbi:hypothetical protein EMIHUDRAFT_99993 [Emiliania huxleyi CCMP1516]|uniref:Major facilitator superfamily (MFS) profile domain-containing protein n=2 Tax=Emiliania huxleyi TaxID=2903 RepID=A0A0D3JYE4_EMIH1|nr:hypothetical protein EMIHUDRAFT_99993 [Emiliania huxleyi CCMP1516]EOD28529.1 hypothetical protein EMIHUDRAFT_99993 [Emiliania huxleyi CCMP1516]|eukprot:XP_005780958.1 hypothetical protein EMIHUDRAFT_99993 [Emiliania huxleyi CCMP1516]